MPKVLSDLLSVGSADVAVATGISEVTDSHHCTVLAVSPLEHQLEQVVLLIL